ncbi:clotting factor B-like isoform X2 [Tachypleus tridentatus]|uniref:clotting factor B-like isoform X2 n=1 Tax=Tachypleus tridentatus TaxID=6853 RepID=UPI003FD6B702
MYRCGKADYHIISCPETKRYIVRIHMKLPFMLTRSPVWSLFSTYLVAISLSQGQKSGWRFPYESQQFCRLYNGDRGRCITITNCPAALAKIAQGVHPKICNWLENLPIVCCSGRNTINVRQPSRVTTPQRRPKRPGNRLERIRPAECGLKKDAINISPVRNSRLRRIRQKTESSPLRKASTFFDLHPRSRRQLFDHSKVPVLSNENNRHIPGIQFAVGGEPALEGAWPWMVSLSISFKPEWKQFCMWSFLIDERHIVSAAHCYADDRQLLSDYKVRIGQVNVYEGRLYDVEAIKVHEGYIKRHYYNDIALIRLKESVSYSDAIAPVCLPNHVLARQDLTGVSTTLLGYGDLSYGGPSTDVLQEVHGIPVISSRDCNRTYTLFPRSPFIRGVTKEFICAGLAEGGKDACHFLMDEEVYMLY